MILKPWHSPVSGYQISINNPRFDIDQYSPPAQRWHDKKTPPPTELQIPATVNNTKPHLCSTSLHYSLFIRRYSCWTTDIIFSKNKWSLVLSLCFTLSLESTPFISSSTSFLYQFLHFRLTYSFTHHFFLFWFTNLLIRNSLSFTSGLKPTCFTNPTPKFYCFLQDCLHRLLPGPFLLSYSVFVFSFSLFFHFYAVRYIMLAITSASECT